MNGACKNVIRIQLQWILPLLAGFSMTVSGVSIYRQFHPTYPDSVVVWSKEMGLPLQKCQEIDALIKKIDNQPVTAQDWVLIKSLADSGNNVQRMYAVMFMDKLYNTIYCASARRYARAFMANSDPFVRSSALSALAKLRDDKWKELALQSRNDPSEVVRKTSVSLLSIVGQR